MKNVRIKVRSNICFKNYDFAIFDGRKLLFAPTWSSPKWYTLKAAIRNAKAMAKRIGIKYDSEIMKQHGC